MFTGDARPPVLFGIRPLPHTGFVETLGTSDENGPAWPMVQAGFLTLRLIDKWDAAGDGGPVPTPREMQAVRRVIFAVETVPIRRYLAQLVETVSSGWGHRSPMVMPMLLAFAHELFCAEEWALAADVYEMVAMYGRTDLEIELAPNAYLRFAVCLQNTGRVDDAQRAYQAAQALGEDACKPTGKSGGVRQRTTIDGHCVRLRAQLGLANLARHRTNYPTAATALDALITEIQTLVGDPPIPAIAEVLAVAKHDRGTIAYLCGQHESAATLYHDALAGAQTEQQRERLLADTATNLADMGLSHGDHQVLSPHGRVFPDVFRPAPGSGTRIRALPP